jgi:hypothetical protein
MTIQETHYVSMAQLVESSPVLTVIEWGSKGLRLRAVSHARFVPSIWMTNFYCQQQNGAREWLTLIKLTVTAIDSLGPPHPQTDPHLGFSPMQKGLLLYVPSTRQIVISGDVICDETLASTVAETQRPFHDALALRPTASFIPDSYTVLEYTGDLLSQFEEGNATANNNQTATTSPFEEDIIHSDLISDPIEDSSEEEIAENSEETTEETESSDIVPQIVDDGLDSNTRRSI